MRTRRDSKKFAVVSFLQEDNALSVVPVKWLVRGNSKSSCVCLWPPYFTDDELKKAVKEEKVPDKKKWRLYLVTVLHQSKTYENAIGSLQTYQLNCGVKLFSPETDDENSSDEIITESFISTPSARKDSHPHTSVRTNSQPSSSVGNDSHPHSSITKDSQPHSSVEKDSQPHSSVVDNPIVKIEQIFPLETDSSNVQSVFNVVCSNCYSLEKKIDTMQQEMNEMKNVLTDLKTQSTYLVTILKDQEARLNPLLMIDFQQLKTMEDIIAFNSNLENPENYSKMVNYFSSFGGKDKHSATRKILSVLMCNDLAMELNWVGGVRKRSIQEFKHIIQLVAAAVRHNKMFSDASVSQIESWIAKWLRYAADRKGIHGKRRNIGDKPSFKRPRSSFDHQL